MKGKDARHTPKPAYLGNKAIRREGAREEKQVSSEHTTQGRGGEGRGPQKALGKAGLEG